MHIAFTITASTAVQSICGDLSYTSTFDSAPISDLTQPVSYSSDSRSFSVYSEDFSLVGTHSISLRAHLSDYAAVVTTSTETTTIEVIDPCLNPFALTLPDQTSSISYSYTGSSPRLSFTPIAAVVSPPVCAINYNCVTLTSPVLGQNICEVSDGATQSSF